MNVATYQIVSIDTVVYWTNPGTATKKTASLQLVNTVIPINVPPILSVDVTNISGIAVGQTLTMGLA